MSKKNTCIDCHFLIKTPAGNPLNTHIRNNNIYKCNEDERKKLKKNEYDKASTFSCLKGIWVSSTEKNPIDTAKNEIFRVRKNNSCDFCPFDNQIDPITGLNRYTNEVAAKERSRNWKAMLWSIGISVIVLGISIYSAFFKDSHQPTSSTVEPSSPKTLPSVEQSHHNTADPTPSEKPDVPSVRTQ